MRRRRVLVALVLSLLINAGSLTLATAEEKPSAEATKQARDKFAKLLLPTGRGSPPTSPPPTFGRRRQCLHLDSRDHPIKAVSRREVAVDFWDDDGRGKTLPIVPRWRYRA